MKNKLTIKKKFDLPKKIKSMKDLSVKVGFPSDNKETQSTDKEGITAVYKATIHNFGLGVPKRPFMNISFAKNKKEYKKLVIKEMSKIKTADSIKFANNLGLKGQGDVQKTIVSLRTPANSQATINDKGSSNPLIDSGHMLQSVTYAVSSK